VDSTSSSAVLAAVLLLPNISMLPSHFQVQQSTYILFAVSSLTFSAGFCCPPSLLLLPPPPSAAGFSGLRVLLLTNLSSTTFLSVRVSVIVVTELLRVPFDAFESGRASPSAARVRWRSAAAAETRRGSVREGGRLADIVGVNVDRAHLLMEVEVG